VVLIYQKLFMPKFWTWSKLVLSVLSKIIIL